jgi:hypothetical protein
MQGIDDTRRARLADRYDFDYIGLESFDFRGPRSDAKIGHARWTLRDRFSHVSWYKGRHALRHPQPPIESRRQRDSNTILDVTAEDDALSLLDASGKPEEARAWRAQGISVLHQVFKLMQRGRHRGAVSPLETLKQSHPGCAAGLEGWRRVEKVECAGKFPTCLL